MLIQMLQIAKGAVKDTCFMILIIYTYITEHLMFSTITITTTIAITVIITITITNASIAISII